MHRKISTNKNRARKQPRGDVMDREVPARHLSGFPGRFPARTSSAGVFSFTLEVGRIGTEK